MNAWAKSVLEKMYSMMHCVTECAHNKTFGYPCIFCGILQIHTWSRKEERDYVERTLQAQSALREDSERETRAEGHQ